MSRKMMWRMTANKASPEAARLSSQCEYDSTCENTAIPEAKARPMVRPPYEEGVIGNTLTGPAPKASPHSVSSTAGAPHVLKASEPVSGEGSWACRPGDSPSLLVPPRPTAPPAATSSPVPGPQASRQWRSGARRQAFHPGRHEPRLKNASLGMFPGRRTERDNGLPRLSVRAPALRSNCNHVADLHVGPQLPQLVQPDHLLLRQTVVGAFDFHQLGATPKPPRFLRQTTSAQPEGPPLCLGRLSLHPVSDDSSFNVSLNSPLGGPLPVHFSCAGQRVRPGRGGRVPACSARGCSLGENTAPDHPGPWRSRPKAAPPSEWGWTQGLNLTADTAEAGAEGLTSVGLTPRSAPSPALVRPATWRSGPHASTQPRALALRPGALKSGRPPRQCRKSVASRRHTPLRTGPPRQETRDSQPLHPSQDQRRRDRRISQQKQRLRPRGGSSAAAGTPELPAWGCHREAPRGSRGRGNLEETGWDGADHRATSHTDRDGILPPGTTGQEKGSHQIHGAGLCLFTDPVSDGGTRAGRPDTCTHMPPCVHEELLLSDRIQPAQFHLGLLKRSEAVPADNGSRPALLGLPRSRHPGPQALSRGAVNLLQPGLEGWRPACEETVGAQVQGARLCEGERAVTPGPGGARPGQWTWGRQALTATQVQEPLVAWKRVSEDVWYPIHEDDVPQEEAVQRAEGGPLPVDP
ncbi:hypothetical protein Cadr_000025949 [Camelus dromedarius]|uniref:Uncharacterized protein n=1 Tax=Camelus dromedarius TaxID=9838 RepID=A0A5N4CEE3_CAMDR|nr:hypothetical protein Cadr_000025949 [Camelus dromedarius]